MSLAVAIPRSRADKSQLVSDAASLSPQLSFHRPGPYKPRSPHWEPEFEGHLNVPARRFRSGSWTSSASVSDEFEPSTAPTSVASSPRVEAKDLPSESSRYTALPFPRYSRAELLSLAPTSLIQSSLRPVVTPALTKALPEVFRQKGTGIVEALEMARTPFIQHSRQSRPRFNKGRNSFAAPTPQPRDAPPHQQVMPSTIDSVNVDSSLAGTPRDSRSSRRRNRHRGRKEYVVTTSNPTMPSKPVVNVSTSRGPVFPDNTAIRSKPAGVNDELIDRFRSTRAPMQVQTKRQPSGPDAVLSWRARPVPFKA